MIIQHIDQKILSKLCNGENTLVNMQSKNTLIRNPERNFCVCHHNHCLIQIQIISGHFFVEALVHQLDLLPLQLLIEKHLSSQC